jgi:hypothetical protein
VKLIPLQRATKAAVLALYVTAVAAPAAAWADGPTPAESEDTIRVVYESLADPQTGLRFELSEFRTWQLHELANVPLEGTVTPPPGGRIRAGTEPAPWKLPGQPEPEVAWGRPGETLGDLAATISRVFSGAVVPRVTGATAFAVRIAGVGEKEPRAGDEEHYRAAFFWLSSEDSLEDQVLDFLMVDAFLSRAEPLAAGGDPHGGMQLLLAASTSALECRPSTAKTTIRFPLESDITGHGPGGTHRGGAKFKAICSCEADCFAQCRPKLVNATCEDSASSSHTDPILGDGLFHVPQIGGAKVMDGNRAFDSARPGFELRSRCGVGFLCSVRRCPTSSSCTTTSSIGLTLQPPSSPVGVASTFTFGPDPGAFWSSTQRKEEVICPLCQLDTAGRCEPERGEDCSNSPDCACPPPSKCDPATKACRPSCPDGVRDPWENCRDCPDVDCSRANAVCNQDTGICEACQSPCRAEGLGTKCDWWQVPPCQQVEYCGNCEGVPGAFCDPNIHRCSTSRICVSACDNECGVQKENSCGVMETCRCLQGSCYHGRCLGRPGCNCTDRSDCNDLDLFEMEGFCGSGIQSCSTTLSPARVDVPAPGAPDLAISISASSCTWVAASEDPWIHISSGVSGTGAGLVRFSVDRNYGETPRTGRISVDDEPVVVVQAGTQCSPLLSPSGASVGPAGTEAASFQAETTCPWTAVPSAPWIEITGGDNVEGSGSVQYRVEANPVAEARSGRIAVGGSEFLVVQGAGDDDGGAACLVVITSGAVGSEGAEEMPITVEASDPECAWVAFSASNWITVTSGSEGSGDGMVTIAVEPNREFSARTGLLSIAGRSHSIQQSGVPCEVALNPTQIQVASAGESGLRVSVFSDCDWEMPLLPGWIILQDHAPAAGPGHFVFDVAPNTSTQPRSRSLLPSPSSASVDGEALQVTQSGCVLSVSFSAPSQAVPSAGATGLTVKLNQTNGPCASQATTDVPWITLTSGASGSDSRTLKYNVAVNKGGARTGRILVGGQTFTVNQAGK